MSTNEAFVECLAVLRNLVKERRKNQRNNHKVLVSLNKEQLKRLEKAIEVLSGKTID